MTNSPTKHNSQHFAAPPAGSSIGVLVHQGYTGVDAGDVRLPEPFTSTKAKGMVEHGVGSLDSEL